MNVRWDNVVIFGLLLLATILLISNYGAIAQIFGDMRVERHHSSERQQFVTFCVFGLLLVSIVAIVKILVHKNQDQ